MNIEQKIHLNRFKPRSFQLPILDAIENKGYKRVIAIMPRRSGKDITAWNLCIRAALRKPCVVFYIFPSYAMAKKVIWDSLLTTGERFLDFIPPALIESINSQEMKIRLKNESLIQLVGSDNYDTLRGTNPQFVVFSEYAYQDERAYTLILRPILAANQGVALFVSTPQGKNHFYSLFEMAKQSSDWFAYFLTLDDTQHIPIQEIERDRAEGLISEDMIQQEYYCSFTLGVEGSYYSKYISNMKLKGQIGLVPWESAFKVNTAWDIGVRDSTSIIFFSIIGQTIRIIDCYEKSKEGLEHYIAVLKNKPYIYGKHFAPHDIAVQEWGSGITRIEKAKNLGLTFTVADNISIVDGIEAVRSTFSKLWIDEKNCAPLIKALENYRQEYDSKKRVYKAKPLHDWSSHFADCMRYLCISLPKTRDGLSPEELDKRYKSAMLGPNANLPSIFRDDLPPY